MRAQRDTVHTTSRRASPARRNSPALDYCEPTWRNASPGDITETTPPGVGRPRGWRHRLGEGVGHPGHGGAASRVAAPGLSAETTPPGGGGLAGGRRGRHDRGHPDRLGRSSLSSSTTASTSVRPGPHGTAAARKRAADDEDRQGRPGRDRRARIKSRAGPSSGRPRRVIRGMRTPAGLARPPAGFGEEGGTGGGEDLRAGAPMG